MPLPPPAVNNARTPVLLGQTQCVKEDDQDVAFADGLRQFVAANTDDSKLWKRYRDYMIHSGKDIGHAQCPWCTVCAMYHHTRMRNDNADIALLDDMDRVFYN